ncbi:MAG: AAA family ATPase, partial [Acidobacteria bacterium]|nr:AAA family ATPase [Acidobacteriota bacterium]
AERAVRAGLGVIDAVKAVTAPAPLQVRVGIATGSVVVGEDDDPDARAGELAVGETPNLAARLQGLAGPDEVIVAPATHRLIRGVFEYEDRGAQTVKGISEPVWVRRVLGQSRAESRFEAATGEYLTPLVGRDEEIALLLRLWQRAKEGEGQVALISGQAGIGKSRITRALNERLAGEHRTGLRCQCSSHYVETAFYPMIRWL